MKRKRPMPPALKAYWAKHHRNPKKRARAPGKRRRAARPGKVTVTNTHTVRRQNPRMSVLYAVKGRERLKYVGGIKFSKKGRAKLFRSREVARTCADMLRAAFPVALRGFALTVASA